MDQPGLWHRNTARELLYFLIIGGVQYALDVSVFSLLALATGWTVASNLVSRALAAACGYYLNGVFTFRALGRHRESCGVRFVIAWLIMTAASTLLVKLLSLWSQVGSQPWLLIAGKAAIELLLFFVGFLLCKLWVFAPAGKCAVNRPPSQGGPQGGLGIRPPSQGGPQGGDAERPPTPAPSAALFILAHADDEFFFAPRIKRLVAAGRAVWCIYTTDGAGYGVSPARRREESAAALARLGVPADRLRFAGIDAGIPDGSAHRQLDDMYAALEQATRDLPIGEIYVPAWEGGHADHDASHLAGVALARARRIEHVYECPGYHGHSRWLPFRVMSFVPRSAAPETLRLGLAEGLFCFALCECHPSQWRTWLGLGPEAFVRLVVQRRHACRPVRGLDYTQPPHPGRLFYEKRFGVTWPDFHAATAPFVARHGLSG